MAVFWLFGCKHVYIRMVDGKVFPIVSRIEKINHPLLLIFYLHLDMFRHVISVFATLIQFSYKCALFPRCQNLIIPGTHLCKDLYRNILEEAGIINENGVYDSPLEIENPLEKRRREKDGSRG